MGRIQDAMRRAAADEGTEGPGTAAEAPARAVESFPDETVQAELEIPAPAEPTSEVFTVEESAVAVPDPAGEAVVPDETEHASPDAADEPVTQMIAGLAAKIVIDKTMMPASREQYRRLAAALHHAQEATGLKVVMIASAVAGEGKSLTAANLALTLSESYRRRVLLVDGDLRRPALHKLFGVEVDTGLSEVLDMPEQPALTLFELSERLTLLPAGRPTSDPMAGLTSVRMRALLDEARERFDWIIVDTPPIGLLSDASLLAAMVDGTLLVVKAGSTHYQLVQRAVESLGGPDRVFGSVLNRVTEPSIHSSYSYYYKYYSPSRVESGGG